MKRTTTLVLVSLAASVAMMSVAADPPAEAKREKEKVLFFVAHPDDIISSIGTCLLMREKFEVHLCDFTCGVPDQHRNPPLIRKRQKEEEIVCKALGAQLHWYDTENDHRWVDEKPCRAFAEFLAKLKPRAVFGHWPMDHHPDHMISAAILMRAVNLAKLDSEVYFFEEAYDSKGFNDTYYVDITSVAEEKRRIIRLYETQNAEDWMCRDEMMNSIIRGKRLYAPNHKTGESDSYSGFYAEAFAPYGGRAQGPNIFAEIPRPSVPNMKRDVWP